jgi:predicted NBD/HSP70 family sugar kinase
MGRRHVAAENLTRRESEQSAGQRRTAAASRQAQRPRTRSGSSASTWAARTSSCCRWMAATASAGAARRADGGAARREVRGGPDRRPDRGVDGRGARASTAAARETSPASASARRARWTGTGTVINTPNLGWRNFPLRDLIANAVGLPATLDNDANCATYGEWWLGAGRERRHAGRPDARHRHRRRHRAERRDLPRRERRGRRDRPHDHRGERPQVQVRQLRLPGGVRVGPGHRAARGRGDRGGRGVAAAGAGQRQARGHHGGDGLRGVVLGDPYANEVMRETAKILGAGIANMINVLNPEMVVIAGGVTRAGDHLFSPLRAEVRRARSRARRRRADRVGAAARHGGRDRRHRGVQEGDLRRRLMRLGVLGTMVWDRIHARDGRAEPVEEWGGISYALAAAAAAAPAGTTIVPLIRVGGPGRARVPVSAHAAGLDLEPACGSSPSRTTASSCATRPGAPLRAADGRRRAVDVAGARARRRDLDALYINFISGFELELPTAHGAAGALPRPDLRRPALAHARRRAGRRARAAAARGVARMAALLRRGAGQRGRAGDAGARVGRSVAVRRRGGGRRAAPAPRHAGRAGRGLRRGAGPRPTRALAARAAAAPGGGGDGRPGPHAAHPPELRPREGRPDRLRRRLGRQLLLRAARARGLDGAMRRPTPRPRATSSTAARRACITICRVGSEREGHHAAGIARRALLRAHRPRFRRRRGERVLFDATHVRWADPYGMVGLLALGRGRAPAGEQPLLKLPDSPTSSATWAAWASSSTPSRSSS